MLTLILTVALSGAPKVDAKLVGTWLAGGQPFVTFNANGSGLMDEGKIKWSADGKNLVVTDDEGTADNATYTLAGDTLTLMMGGIPIPLTRAGAGVQVKKQGALAAKAEKANRVSEDEADREAMAEAQAWLQKNGQGQPQQGRPAMPPQPMQQQQRAGNDQLSQLLLSSSWCSFSYNKISGASNTTKVTFYPDGSWGLGARGETYNSGAYGSVAGQHDSSGGGRWAVQNGVLLMSSAETPQLTPVPGFSVTRNSNGYPIINSMGKEYSSCN